MLITATRCHQLTKHRWRVLLTVLAAQLVQVPSASFAAESAPPPSSSGENPSGKAADGSMTFTCLNNLKGMNTVEFTWDFRMRLVGQPPPGMVDQVCIWAPANRYLGCYSA